MLPYYALTGAVVLLSIVSEVVRRHFTNERRRASPIATSDSAEGHRWTPIDFVIIAIMVSFSALRYGVGTDYGMYIRQFEQINTSDWQEQIDASPQEVGYTVLSLALRTVSGSSFTIFWVMATLTVVPIYITLKKKSENVPFALGLFIMLAFFVSPFNVIRQGAAISLNFWANTFIDKNKRVYILLNIIASLFHTSVIIIAILQWLVKNWRPSMRQAIILLGTAIVFAFGIGQIPAISGWLALLNPRYETYVGAESAGIGTYLLIAAYLGLLVFSSSIAPLGENARYNAYVLMGTAFLIVGTQSVVLSRMEMYMSIFLIVLIPNQIAKQRKKSVSIFVVLSVAAVFFGFYLTNWAGLVPYETYIGVVR